MRLKPQQRANPAPRRAGRVACRKNPQRVTAPQSGQERLGRRPIPARRVMPSRPQRQRRPPNAHHARPQRQRRPPNAHHARPQRQRRPPNAHHARPPRQRRPPNAHHARPPRKRRPPNARRSGPPSQERKGNARRRARGTAVRTRPSSRCRHCPLCPSTSMRPYSRPRRRAVIPSIRRRKQTTTSGETTAKMLHQRNRRPRCAVICAAAACRRPTTTSQNHVVDVVGAWRQLCSITSAQRESARHRSLPALPNPTRRQPVNSHWILRCLRRAFRLRSRQSSAARLARAHSSGCPHRCPCRHPCAPPPHPLPRLRNR